MLNTDPALFADLGYCLFPDVLDPQETAPLRRMLDEALATPLPRHAAAHRRLVGRGEQRLVRTARAHRLHPPASSQLTRGVK